MIYSRFGTQVRLTRPITTTAEVQKLDKRSTDTQDLQRLEYGMYAAVVYDGEETEHLFDLGMLRAEGGIREINEAARAVGCDPK